MSKFCCDEFAEHTTREGYEAGAIGFYGEYGWVMVADGGAWAAVKMNWCPWCGSKLTESTTEAA